MLIFTLYINDQRVMPYVREGYTHEGNFVGISGETP